MPKKKTPDEKPADQFKRFVETAREHGVEENDGERAFKKLAGSTRESKPKSKTGPQ